jgi:hypothetical protein
MSKFFLILTVSLACILAQVQALPTTETSVLTRLVPRQVSRKSPSRTVRRAKGLKLQNPPRRVSSVQAAFSDGDDTISLSDRVSSKSWSSGIDE